ncbi:MAG: hypothetical protein IPO17_16635 [Flavobacteriales bacterium]|nr:hypothetical protein [Flavobacteriales bacterium]MBK7554858.1 hypothetical protein [Flavobacteriales bacterium]MBK9196573.1 hypothetical protein [Flavobacteriales bacterium]
MRSIRAALLPVPMFLAIATNAQEEPEQERKLNDEIGLDMTYFIIQFTQDATPGVDLDPYYLTYRHLFRKVNLRAGIGVLYKDSQEDISSFNPYPQHTTSTTFDVRVGAEQAMVLTRRWSCFYGVDLLFGMDNNFRDNIHQFGEFHYYGQETNTTTAGGAAVLGIRFNINKRISLLTEASWRYTIGEEAKRTFYEPISEGVPYLEDDTFVTQVQQVAFSPPLSIRVTVSL